MLGIIMKREFKALLNSKPMRITTILVVTLILIAGLVGRFLLSDDGDSSDATVTETTYTIGVEESASDAAPLIDAIDGVVTSEVIADGEGSDWLSANVPDAEDAYYAVIAGTPEAPVAIFPNQETPGTDMDDYMSEALILWTADSVAGPLTPEQASAIASTEDNVHTQFLEIGSDGNLLISDPVGYLTSLIAIMLLTMAVMSGLTTISTGVVEEKVSRVVEILLTSVRPRTLLLGKILGIGAFVLLQFLLFILAAVVALNIAGLWMDLGIGATVVWTIVWTVLGFFIFSMIAGALASTVSRQEDLGAITTPLSFLALIPLYLALFLVPSQPESTLTQVISYIPFFSSFMMPVRSAYGVVGTNEQMIAAAIALVAIPLLAMVAGKIYQNSILRTGKRISVREALKSGN